MKSEPVILPADPNDAEDFDVSAEALDRGQRAPLIRRTRTALCLSRGEVERWLGPVLKYLPVNEAAE